MKGLYAILAIIVIVAAGIGLFVNNYSITKVAVIAFFALTVVGIFVGGQNKDNNNNQQNVQ